MKDLELFVDYRPARGTRPTLVLLNGLSSSTDEWERFAEPFLAEGYGIFRFDFRGQGQSLRRELEKFGKFDERVSIGEQTEDLRLLLEKYRVPAPYTLVGMSYGGGVGLHFGALYPEKVSNLILVVPYLIRLDQAYPMQRVWSDHLETLRNFAVLGEKAVENAERWYQQILTLYMDSRFYRHIPDPVVRRASIQLSLGIMEFNAFSILHKLPPSSLHLVSVGQDTLVPENLYQEFWAKLPSTVKESWLQIQDGEHLILEQFPDGLSTWVKRVIERGPETFGGRRSSFRGADLLR